jgi:hypothetical protein
MNGSNGNIAELLERLIAENAETRKTVAEGFAQVNKNLVQTNVDVAQLRGDMNAGFAQLRSDMNKGFAQVNTRVDNALKIAGGRYDDHEQRIVVLEEHVLGKKSG